MDCLDSPKRISARRLSRLSPEQSGISCVSLSNSNHHLLHNYDEFLANIGRLCSVTCHSSVRKFIKCIKQLPSCEYVITLLNELDLEISKDVISRLRQCRQVKEILIVRCCNIDYAKKDFSSEMISDVGISKAIENFNEHQLMFVRLKELIHVAKEQLENDTIFITLNGKQNALRDLRQELGSFIWIHTFKCECAYEPLKN